MNSYEIIRRNVAFDYPDRVGLRFNSLGVSDVFRIYTQLPRSLRPDPQAPVRMDKKLRTPPGHIDEWGCKWEASGDAAGGDDMGLVLDAPLKNWSDFENFIFPDPANPDRFDGLEPALEVADGRFVQLNSPFCMFERMHFMRGFETIMNDFILQPAEVEKFADKVINYQIGIVNAAAERGKGRIHCFDTTDDWGSQNAMFISPRMWRAIFKPRYKRLIDAIHAGGMLLRFHTDGKINAILPDLVELGVDILNVHQPRLLGIDEVAESIAGRICFEVSVDIQSTLPTGDKEAIQSEVRELLGKWASPKGGLIGVEYRYGAAIGITRQALQWELEALQQFGTYRK